MARGQRVVAAAGVVFVECAAQAFHFVGIAHLLRVAQFGADAFALGGAAGQPGFGPGAAAGGQCDKQGHGGDGQAVHGGLSEVVKKW